MPKKREAIVPRRLRTLRESGESKRAFARRLGVDHRRLDEWLDGTRAPSADSLRQIARKAETTTDYLLGLTEQPRPSGDLAGDLAAAIGQRVAAALEIRNADALAVDGCAVLDRLAEEQTAQFRAYAESRARAGALLGSRDPDDQEHDWHIVAAVMQALDVPVPLVQWRHEGEGAKPDAAFFDAIREQARWSRKQRRQKG